MKGPVKILGHTVPLAQRQRGGTSPWDYVKNWSKSDKGPEETLEKLNERMQNRWPGNYKIVNEPSWNGKNYYINEYVFKFDTPADETWFTLRWA